MCPLKSLLYIGRLATYDQTYVSNECLIVLSSPLPAQDPGTRAALLDAAAEIFAERGFAEAKVRDIAASARANLAAINYHFGGKEGLYLAVLEREASRVIERYPLSPPEAAADGVAALRDVIAGLLGRFLASDARSYAPRLIIREMLNPTAALAQIVERITRPQFEQVYAALARVLGPRVPAERLRLCVFSVVGQCMFYLAARPMVDQVAPGTTAVAARDALVDHVLGLTVAGLGAVRREYEETNDA